MTNKLSPLFIGGAGRSGTTLLRVIMDSHSNIACGPEFKLIPRIAQQWEYMVRVFSGPLRSYGLGKQDINGIFRQFIEGLLDKYKTAAGKGRIAEKTPGNVLYFTHLNQMFPESPLIHVIRDGRDVVCSLRTMNWVTMRGNRKVPYVESAKDAAEYWVNTVSAGVNAGREYPVRERYYEIRYEDIVVHPETTLHDLFDFIGEPWERAVLDYYTVQRDLARESSASQVSRALNTRSVGRWRTDLNAQDKETVKRIAGPLLIDLGYAADDAW